MLSTLRVFFQRVTCADTRNIFPGKAFKSVEPQQKCEPHVVIEILLTDPGATKIQFHEVVGSIPVMV